jgi:hypothetical protein
MPFGRTSLWSPSLSQCMICLVNWMSEMRSQFNIVVLTAILAGLPVAGLPLAGFTVSVASAQRSDGFPFSIMAPDASERRARQRARKAPPPQAAPEARDRAKTAPRRARRGSSTASTIPTYRSPLTPLGTVRPNPTAPSMAYPASPPGVVPGIGGVAGTPAIAPGRPAGQSFQDRTSNCIMSGSAQGVGAGQIGSFTQNCVNR